MQEPSREPKQSRSRAMVSAMLEAVSRLTAQRELAVTTNEVARVAGVSVGSIYQYFPSKDSLLSAWLRGMVRTRIAHLRQAVEDGERENLERAVARLIDAAIRYRQGGPGTERALWSAFLRFGGDELSRAVDAEVIPIFARLLESHADETRPLDRELSAFIIFYALRMILTVAGMVPELLTHPPLRDELVRLVVGYVRR